MAQALAALYVPPAMKLATLETLMTPPVPRATMPGSAACAEAHDRDDEHVDHLLLGVDVAVDEELVDAEARVVDQHVDRARAVAQPGLDRRELGAIGEVGDAAPRTARDDARSSSAANAVEALLVACDEDEVVAAGRELARELRADPCRALR